MSVPSGKEREERIAWLRAVPTNPMWAWTKFAEELADALEALTAAEQERTRWREDWITTNAALADTQDKLMAAQKVLSEANRKIFA